MRRSLAILLGLALLALTGCGLAEKAVENAAEKAVEKATGVSVDEEGGTVTIKGKDGESISISGESKPGKLPDGFPFPLYQGAKVTSSSKMSSSGKASYFVELSFKGDIGAAADFYEKAMKDLGCEDLSRTETETDGELSVMLMGGNEKSGGWIIVEMDSESKEGMVSFVWSDN